MFSGQYSDAADAQFSVSNPGGSSPGSFSGVAVVANGSSGATGQWQYFNTSSATWVDVGARSTASALLIGSGTSIRFNPALDFVGAAPTLTVHLIDNSLAFGITFGQVVDLSGLGATGGTSAYSAGTVVLSEQVNPAQFPPVLDLNGPAAGIDAALAYTENSPATVIAPDAQLTDADSPDFDTGSLTVSFQANGTSADQLFIRNQGSGAGQIGISGPNITYGGVAIGVFAGGFNGTALLFTFNANATPLAVEALVRNITYFNNSEAPSTLSRTVNFTVTDGDGGTSQANAAVNITAINDAPILTVPATVSGTEDTNIVFSVANGNAITVSDVDTPILTLTLSALHGTFTLAQTTGLSFTGNGVNTITIRGTQADINAALDGLIYRGDQDYQGNDNFNVILHDSNTFVTAFRVITLAGDGFIEGTAGNDVLTGTAGDDTFLLQQGGIDNVSGLGGNDFFYFGAAMTSDDIVNGGALGRDRVALQGNYTITLNGNVTNIEAISVLSGNDTRFGDTANNFYDYSITIADANFDAVVDARINGNTLRAGEDFLFNGSAEDDSNFIIFGGGGVDTLTGGSLNDLFVFGLGSYGPADRAIGGGGTDTLVLRGNFSIDYNFFPPLALQSIETIMLSSATDTRYLSGGGTEFDYNVTWNDILLASGATMTVDGLLLQSNETMVFDGSTELDGTFRLFGGASADTLRGGGGNDTIFGGLGADTLNGGTGIDIYRYDNVAESTSASRDTIQNFALGDQIDLSRIDANTLAPGDQQFTFIGAAAFVPGAPGLLRAVQGAPGQWTVQGDVNGDGVADFEILVLVTDGHPFAPPDFIL